MCGIFAYLGGATNSISIETLREYAYKCQHRGPDETKELYIEDFDLYFVFHRLAINGLNPLAGQPFTDDEYIAMCNGEIYNYRKLSENFNIKLTTGSDCEIIIPLLKKTRDIKETCQLFDGVYATIVWHKGSKTLMVARDPIGVRSLFYGYDDHQNFIVASELKCFPDSFIVKQVPPGHFMYITPTGVTKILPHFELLDRKTIMSRCSSTSSLASTLTEFDVEYVKELLTAAVEKRLMSERPMGCLLSGGLDSSIIAAIISKYQHLHTFSIGLKDSPDILAARVVAKHLNTNHTEVIVTEEEMLSAIPEVIKQIESYDVTTVRASVPMYLLSKWIKENTDIVVIFSGEGSDEIFGSYLYFRNAPSPEEFQDETYRLIKSLHYFDVLRADKSTAGHGLEIRVPFLDKTFVQYCAGIPAQYKVHAGGIEKKILREAFSDYLPEEIINRRKEAFSDGVSLVSRSWSTIIQEYLAKSNMQEIDYYKNVFNYYYPNMSYIIPYQWLPKWCAINDPSARCLNVYHV